MSSRLVRKGLELVCSDEAASSNKRKSPAAHHGSIKGIKRAKQKPRGGRGRHEKKSTTAKVKTKPAVDFTEQNLQYFTNTSWRIDQDTYNKILERQTKSCGTKTQGPEPQEKDSETEEFGLETD